MKQYEKKLTNDRMMHTQTILTKNNTEYNEKS